MKYSSFVQKVLPVPLSKTFQTLLAVSAFAFFIHISFAVAEDSKCSESTVLGSPDKKCEQPPDTVQSQVLSPQECNSVTSSEVPMCSNSTTSVSLTDGCSQKALACKPYGPAAPGGTTPKVFQMLETGGSKKSGVKQ